MVNGEDIWANIKEHKPDAKCRFANECYFYNHNVIRPDVELAMCGRGQPEDKAYEPLIPVPENFTPARKFEDGLGGHCEVFMFYENEKLLGKIVQPLYTIVDALKEHGKW